ncbi:hypothetical protein Clacol_003330 [Clathrus columnatus]|uniref:Uncharacterized protein n=1 Tax=Clathrus columnatus TaxID=1419009 RepID=A0AAV5A6K3_9AGAM|nr:hypothetical protein Clacol_003330 [Clathrus columnatus]
MPSSLPPDQSLSISTLDQRLVILSVSEDGLKIGKGTDYVDFAEAGYPNGVYLYTENLAITSDIRGKDLTISTFSLQCANDGVIVNTNGAPGEDSVDTEAADGSNAGTLSVFVQDLSDATARALTLQAQGGDGGNTYLADGSVGNGGNGGTINSVFQPTYVQVLAVVDQYFNGEAFHPEGTDEEIQEGYDAPVAIGDSLYEDGKTVLSLAQVLSAEEDVIKDIFQPLADEISKIEDEGTRTVLQLKLGVNNSRHNLQNAIMNQQSFVAPMDSNVQGGYAGVGINVHVEPGQAGSSGHQNQVFISALSEKNFADAPFPIAHPVHCSMLLQRANVFFYINSPSLRAYARLLYERVINRLSFLPLEPGDPLYEAYRSSTFMPSTALADFERIKTQASNLLVQLNAGSLNFNGLGGLWVPRASYTFYSDVLDKALDDLAIFEDAYVQYQDALNKQQNLNDKLSIAYNNTSGILASLSEDEQDLKLSIQDLDRQIRAEAPVVEKARQELMDAYEAELDAIKNSFGLSLPQLINALTMIAFSPTKLMGGVQIGDLFYQGFNSVPTIDGVSVNKEYLASEIKESEASIEDITTLLGDKINSQYQLDDPFATRLITEKENMLKLLNQFSQNSFGGVNDEEARKNLMDKFDALIDAVTKRNGIILDYNVTINLLLSKIAEGKDYKEKQEELVHRQVTYNDPDLPAITAYVGAIYQASRSRVMKLIDILLRSLNFRMVITSDVYNYIFPSSDPDDLADLDQVPLGLTAVVLRSVRANIEDEFDQQVEHWGSEPAKFPRDFDVDEGKQFHLKSYELEELLEDDEHTACIFFKSYLFGLTNICWKIVITIPKVDKYSTDGGDFEGCCNIRIYRVRFVLAGLKASAESKKALVQFTLTQGGNETIMDRSNAAYKFEHDPVSTIFSFRVDDKGTRSILDNGNIGESNINELATSYAAPGPFAEWTISMKGTEWENLDTSEITDGYFDFCGTNYTFN